MHQRLHHCIVMIGSASCNLHDPRFLCTRWTKYYRKTIFLRRIGDIAESTAVKILPYNVGSCRIKIFQPYVFRQEASTRVRWLPGDWLLEKNPQVRNSESLIWVHQRFPYVSAKLWSWPLTDIILIFSHGCIEFPDGDPNLKRSQHSTTSQTQCRRAFWEIVSSRLRAHGSTIQFRSGHNWMCWYLVSLVIWTHQREKPAAV